jgi:galactokinase
VPASSSAFAPGRVNLIGEHTDYNQGLALPFAIADGVTVRAVARADRRVHAYAHDLDERDDFELDAPTPASGWRAFVRGVAAELTRGGFVLPGVSLEIRGTVQQGAGLSSSAALAVALCLALCELCLAADDDEVNANGHRCALGRIEIARLCSRVENEWAGARTGLLDQLASLFGAPDSALCIDFRTLAVEPVPLLLDGWHLVVLDSGERHQHASSGYNERRAECARACELLGVTSLRDAGGDRVASLPDPLDRRVAHVLEENERVLAAVAALERRDLAEVAQLLSASHASLRDLYEISTAAVDATVERLLHAGAAGARMIGGGFGGSVLALFAPEVPWPTDAREVHPGVGAHLLRT